MYLSHERNGRLKAISTHRSGYIELVRLEAAAACGFLEAADRILAAVAPPLAYTSLR